MNRSGCCAHDARTVRPGRSVRCTGGTRPGSHGGPAGAATFRGGPPDGPVPEVAGDARCRPMRAAGLRNDRPAPIVERRSAPQAGAHVPVPALRLPAAALPRCGLQGDVPPSPGHPVALPEAPAAVRRDLAELQPSQRLHVVDFPRHRQDDLVPGNVVSLQIGFEHAGPSDYARLLPAVGELADAGLRRTVWEWVVRRARRDGVDLGEVNVEGTYFRSRIGDNFRRATEAWFAEGRAEGVEEGLREGRAEGIREGRAEGVEKGLAQQRMLLGRLVATKFGPEASARVMALLARIAEPARLVEVGEGLLVCATEEDLVARVETVIESKAQPPDNGRSGVR